MPRSDNNTANSLVESTTSSDTRRGFICRQRGAANELVISIFFTSQKYLDVTGRSNPLFFAWPFLHSRLEVVSTTRVVSSDINMHGYTHAVMHFALLPVDWLSSFICIVLYVL